VGGQCPLARPPFPHQGSAAKRTSKLADLCGVALGGRLLHDAAHQVRDQRRHRTKPLLLHGERRQPGARRAQVSPRPVWRV